MDEKNVWLVEHPTWRYNEDVKALARKAGLRIIDAAAASDEDIANRAPEDVTPALTQRAEQPQRSKRKE